MPSTWELGRWAGPGDGEGTAHLQGAAAAQLQHKARLQHPSGVNAVYVSKASQKCRFLRQLSQCLALTTNLHLKRQFVSETEQIWGSPWARLPSLTSGELASTRHSVSFSGPFQGPEPSLSIELSSQMQPLSPQRGRGQQ